MTGSPVRRRKSVPAPLHKSECPAGTTDLIGPILGPHRRGGYDMSIPTAVTNTCATP